MIAGEVWELDKRGEKSQPPINSVHFCARIVGYNNRKRLFVDKLTGAIECMQYDGGIEGQQSN